MKKIYLKPFVGINEVTLEGFLERMSIVDLEQFGGYCLEVRGLSINNELIMTTPYEIETDQTVLLKNKIFFYYDSSYIIDGVTDHTDELYSSYDLEESYIDLVDLFYNVFINVLDDNHNEYYLDSEGTVFHNIFIMSIKKFDLI
jgi:hypothetical protein